MLPIPMRVGRPNILFPRRRAFTSVYAAILMVVMLGIASLAVDAARARLVRTELRRTADAAARAAARDFASSGTTAAQTAAVNLAAANTADGTPVVLDSANDVEFGLWNTSTKTFTVLTGTARSGANAIRVTARRTAARGTAVPVLLGKLVGKSSADVQASSVAMFTTVAPSDTGIGFVGLSSFNSSGLTTDSYDASSGTYGSQSHGSAASILSNADMSIWNSTIKGDARPGKNKTVYGGTVTGSKTPLTSKLSYTAATFPTSNNNANISPQMNYSTGTFSGGDLNIWGAITLPGGTYVLSNLYCWAPLTFTGPTKLYITGQCNTGGSGYIGTYQNKPANLLLVVNGSLNLYGAQPVYADVYSPLADLNMSPGGNNDFYGQIIVDTWAVWNMDLHYDTSLPGHSPSGGGVGSGSGSGSGSSSSGTTVSIVQ